MACFDRGKITSILKMVIRPMPTSPRSHTKVGHIGAGIKQDPDEGGEAEQPEGDGDEDHAEGAQMVIHGRLEKIHALQTVYEICRSQEHDKG